MGFGESVQERYYNVPPKDLYDAMERYLRDEGPRDGFKLKSCDPLSLGCTFGSGVSMTTWGETLTASVLPQGEGSIVRLGIASRLGTTAFAFQGMHNVKVATKFFDGVSAQAAAARDTAHFLEHVTPIRVNEGGMRQRPVVVSESPAVVAARARALESARERDREPERCDAKAAVADPDELRLKLGPRGFSVKKNTLVAGVVIVAIVLFFVIIANTGGGGSAKTSAASATDSGSSRVMERIPDAGSGGSGANAVEAVEETEPETETVTLKSIEVSYTGSVDADTEIRADASGMRVAGSYSDGTTSDALTGCKVENPAKLEAGKKSTFVVDCDGVKGSVDVTGVAVVPLEYRNALRSAESYVSVMPFSKEGLYKQLNSEYGEKYSAEAARYAVDNVKTDGKENALKSGRNYLDIMGFSPDGLYDQLVSEYGEQYTPEEAQYAIDELFK